MKDNIVKIDIKDNYRIIAISDVHAHLAVFESLLKKIHLKAEDYLIIIGDFINKGSDNLATLNYMMKLSKRPNTIILKGNHESFICYHLVEGGSINQFLRYLKENHFRTIVHELSELIGFDLYGCQDANEMVQQIMSNFKDEILFMDTLPAIAFVDDYIFVHGGFEEDIDASEEEIKLLKFDDFNRLSKINDRKVIVGHWPTANLRTDTNTNEPYFNLEKNIISIDGGMGVKSSGELNALIIEKKDGQEHIDFIQENHFETRIIKESHQFTTEEKIFVNYPHFDIEILEKGPLLSKCMHVQSGLKLSIFNSLLEEKHGTLQVKTTFINHFLNLDVGEEVEVCMEYEDCALVKHAGEFGWILKRQI